MATIKKVMTAAGARYRIQISLTGHPRESATRTTKAEAVAWAAARETELRHMAVTGVQQDRTVDEAFHRYEKEVSAHKRGKRWEAVRLAAIGRMELAGVALKDMRLHQVTPETLGKLRDQRLAKVSGATVNREFNLLSHVFSTAVKEWKWIAASPTTGVRRPKAAAARDRLPTDDEIARICLALGVDVDQLAPASTKNEATAIAFLFAIETAMRAGEICDLIPSDIVGRVANLRKTKNGTKRSVPLSMRAVDLLKLLPPADAGEPVFGISSASRDALFRKATARALVEGLTFHDSRHLAITRLAKKLDILPLARMVGHRDLRQLQVYYNERAEDMALRLG